MSKERPEIHVLLAEPNKEVGQGIVSLLLSKKFSDVTPIRSLEELKTTKDIPDLLMIRLSFYGTETDAVLSTLRELRQTEAFFQIPMIGLMDEHFSPAQQQLSDQLGLIICPFPFTAEDLEETLEKIYGS